MFEPKKCATPPARLDRIFSASDNDGERRAIAALRCPSGAPLKYVTSRPPNCGALAAATMSDKELWMHDHVMTCTRCGAQSVATFSRPGDQPPPSGVAVRSQPRPERYLVQHRLLPYALFSNPSTIISRLTDCITKPVAALWVLNAVAAFCRRRNGRVMPSSTHNILANARSDTLSRTSPGNTGTS